jgi:hypothetical protein
VSRLVSLVLGFVLSLSVAHAQVSIPGTNLTVTSVNGGTGTLVTVPISGAAGLSVTVGTGSAAVPLQDIRNNPAAVNITTYDDSYNNVPLGFDFPFFGKTFNNSWAMTNGLVTFQDPNRSGLGGACCEGVDLSKTTDARYNYTIYGLHTDLYSWNGQNQYYLRGTNEMTYGWYNVSQCCSSQGGNSFEIKINSAGLVDTRVAGAMVNWNRVTSGMAGDLSKGEFYQYYHGQGLNITAGSSSIFSWQALSGTGGDLCAANPLSSPTCAGYQAAYTVQQCTISALYDPSCPGYAAAFFTQQCSISALYDPSCPGYATAYHDQQCSINALYATDCSGYEQAYLNAQCIKDSLYSTKCEGYATAYAIKYLVPLDSSVTTAVNASLSNTAAVKANDPTNTVVATNTASTTINTDGTVSTGVSKTGDTNVDKAIAPPPPTANSSAAPAAVVQLAPPPPPAAQAPQERKPEGKPEGGDRAAGGPPQMAQGQQGGDSKPAQPTARQELQAKREANARAEAIEKGKNLANEMGKVADIESQKQLQNVVIQAMGFTPGFDTYGKATIPDVAGYKPYSVYNNQKNIDNRTTLRMFGGADRLHNEMVDLQYNKEK